MSDIKLKSLLPSSPLKEDYPTEFSFEKFNAIKSYAGKLKYAHTLLKRISSGTSRVAYQIDDTKVLKIAKNPKGLAQNETECDWSAQSYGVTAEVFERDDNYFWLEMELAKKISPNRFKALAGFSIQDMYSLMFNLQSRMQPRGSTMFNHKLSDELNKITEENEFYQDIERFISDFGMAPMDYAKLSSFGEVIRDGKPKAVLIDFGLTQDVFNSHYKK